MLEDKSQIGCYPFRIDLIKPISFICNLIYQLEKLNHPETKISEIFNPEFISGTIGIEIKQEDDGTDIYNIDGLAAKISEYYNSSAIKNLPKKGNSILFFYYPKNLVFTTRRNHEGEKKNIKEAITTYIKEKEIFKNLAEQINNPNLRNVILSSMNLQFQELYYNCVSIEEEVLIESAYFNSKIFNTDKCQFDIIDENDIMVNKKYEGDLPIEIATDTPSDIKILRSFTEDKWEDLAICYGSHCIPITAKSYINFIKQDEKLDYYWSRISSSFGRIEDRKIQNASKDLEFFKEAIKDVELSYLLSHLKQNLYLDREKLTDDHKYKAFFNDVNYIEKLDHVNDFRFFVSTTEGKTALGIYKDIKPEGSSSYNLLHWGLNKDGRLANYRRPGNPTILGLPSVFALKPEIAFYFIANFFEDFIENALKETKCDYLRNFKLYTIPNIAPSELDFVIKTRNKIIVIETKTTLNKFYIEQQQIKAEKLLNIFGSYGIEVEFVLLSAYSLKDCEDTFWYFKKDMPNYNIAREGLATIPYYFEIPIPGKSSQILKCYSEPEYEKLVAIVDTLCQI